MTLIEVASPKFNGNGRDDEQSSGEYLLDESSVLAYDVRMVQHMCLLSDNLSSSSTSCIQPGIAWTERLRRQAEALLRDDWACDTDDASRILFDDAVYSQNLPPGDTAYVNRTLLDSWMHQRTTGDFGDTGDTSSDEDKCVHELVRNRVDLTLKQLSEVKDVGTLETDSYEQPLIGGQWSGDLAADTDGAEMFNCSDDVAHSTFIDAGNDTEAANNVAGLSNVMLSPDDGKLRKKAFALEENGRVELCHNGLTSTLSEPFNDPLTTNLENFVDAPEDSCDSQCQDLHQAKNISFNQCVDSCNEDAAESDNQAAETVVALGVTCGYEAGVVWRGFMRALPLNTFLLLLLLLILILFHSNIFISSHLNHDPFGQRPI